MTIPRSRPTIGRRSSDGPAASWVRQGSAETAASLFTARLGIVERMADGVWKIPQNLIEQGRAFDREKTGGMIVNLRSYIPLARQTQALGATWLDAQLIAGGKKLSASAFGADVCEAAQRRADFLMREGFAERRGQRLVLPRNLLQTLRNRELTQTAATIRAETGLAYQTIGQDGHVQGVYRKSLQLISGRYAMLDNGVGFTLVPWRPVIEQRLGHVVSATLRAGRVTWAFGRQRGPAL